MKLTIDTTEGTLAYETDGGSRTLGLYTSEAFELISWQWVRVGWNQKHAYTFTWMGRPIIQLPEDMIRIQEVIYALRPDVIVESGIAHGGSVIYYASLCKAMQNGRVIGIDIEIRPHNRAAIESHELFPLITLVEGSSTAPDVVGAVRSSIQPGDSAMVILDSCHTKRHVLAELEAYCDVVTPGSYIVATDGIMRDLYDVPCGNPDWIWDNPSAAALEFCDTHPEFVLQEPGWSFNESELRKSITHWPGAWLRRK